MLEYKTSFIHFSLSVFLSSSPLFLCLCGNISTCQRSSFLQCAAIFPTTLLLHSLGFGTTVLHKQYTNGGIEVDKNVWDKPAIQKLLDKATGWDMSVLANNDGVLKKKGFNFHLAVQVAWQESMCAKHLLWPMWRPNVSITHYVSQF